MSYKSTLKGWGIDRALEANKAGLLAATSLKDIFAASDEFVEYAYIPEKEFQDCISVISQILKETPDALDKINQLQAELGVIEEDIHRQMSMQKAGKKQIREATKKGAH